MLSIGCLMFTLDFWLLVKGSAQFNCAESLAVITGKLGSYLTFLGVSFRKPLEKLIVQCDQLLLNLVW